MVDRSSDRRSSPAILRRELADRLRELRVRSGLTIDEVASRLGAQPSKVSRLETGRRPGTIEDVRELAELYRVGPDELAELLELSLNSRTISRWRQYGALVSDHAELEENASRISHYETSIVPGLLQAEDYARAVTAGFIPDLGPGDREKLVQGRLARQALLLGRDEPRLDYVLDESALLRQVGGPSVMRQQLRTLLDRSRLPGISIRVLPMTAGAHPGMDTAFEILAIPRISDVVVYLEGYAGTFFLRKPAEVARYGAAFQRVRDLALDRDASRTLIEQRAAELSDR